MATEPTGDYPMNITLLCFQRSKYSNRALNDESFLKELGKLAKKYNSKGGDATSREIAELSLDVIQTWGEAFLPRSATYPNIPKLYHTLRKEGLPFRPQYDATRVPIFTPPPVIPDDPDGALYAPSAFSGAGRGGGGGDIDADLAAAMALSLADSRTEEGEGGASRARERPPPPPAAASRAKAAEIVEGCRSSASFLKEVILATSDAAELRGSEMVEEVASQLRLQQGQLVQLVEEELARESEVGAGGSESYYILQTSI